MRKWARQIARWKRQRKTVFVYFAAWALGLGVVPINVEESTDKKRYILEHSEASVVFCWQDYVEEIKGIQDQLPSLREVVIVGEEFTSSRSKRAGVKPAPTGKP